MYPTHEQLSATIRQAFPIGIPRTTNAGVAIDYAHDGSTSVGRFYEAYYPALDRNYTIFVKMSAGGLFDVAFQYTENGERHVDEERGKPYAERLREAYKNPVNLETHIDLSDLLAQLKEILGARNIIEKAKGGRNEHTTSKNNENGYTSYRISGPGGRMIVRLRPEESDDGGDYFCTYRSGASSRTDRVSANDKEHAQNFLLRIAKEANVSKVWHKGAVALIEEYFNQVPIQNFRHFVNRNPCYNYDHPFCDIVLEDFPNVPVLRITHEGFQFWKDGKFTTTQDIKDFDGPRIEVEHTFKNNHLWRLGAGLIYTKGKFSKDGFSYTFTPAAEF